jgi:hypothetical protein
MGQKSLFVLTQIQNILVQCGQSAQLLNVKPVGGGRDNSVGIATSYRLEGPGIHSRWGRDFPQPSRLALGATQPPIQWITGLLPRVKAAGAWC